MLFVKILGRVSKRSNLARVVVRNSSTSGPTVEPSVAKEEEEGKRSVDARGEGESQNRLLPQLIAKMRMTGPMTVGDYMKEALTHPKHGYYMKGDVFGARGDFVTSPEISPMFGEVRFLSLRISF
jgi:NADH dehydrogenase [ubiquinone] 1 alpha subcomplex assembly factor 7